MGRGKRVESVLSLLPEPTEAQQIVIVTALPGGNLLQVQSAEGRVFLCRVPAKFRGRVWTIKGGYLIVDMLPGDEDGEALGKVQGTLAHHLYRDQIKHLKNRDLWPAGFDAAEEPPADTKDDDDGYGDLDDELHRNNNRRGGLSSDEEDEEEEEGGEEEEEEEAEAVAQSAAAATPPSASSSAAAAAPCSANASADVSRLSLQAASAAPAETLPEAEVT